MSPFSVASFAAAIAAAASGFPLKTPLSVVVAFVTTPDFATSGVMVVVFFVSPPSELLLLLLLLITAPAASSLSLIIISSS